MPSPGETDAPRRPSIFLSYPSEDRESARTLRDALSAAGLEVWYDEEELTGGDAWDQKIRRQIRECDYFMPLISAQSESRREGYFRREWRLAVERTLDMADDHLFLLPVVTDATEQAGARVPEKFLSVQWLRVPGGRATPALQALSLRLLRGEAAPAANPPRRVPPPLTSAPPGAAAPAAPAAPATAIPPFPNQEPGQPVKFWAHVVMWLGRASWIQFKRLPRLLRIVICLYLAYVIISDGRSKRSAPLPVPRPDAAEMSTKLKAIAARYDTGDDKGDAVKLGADIAHALAAELGDKPAARAAVLAAPFTTDGASPEEERVARSAFGMLYGQLSIAMPGKVGLEAVHLGPGETAAAQAKGLLRHAHYLVLGGVETVEGQRVLTVEIMRPKSGAYTWVQHYPLTAADPVKIAAEVEKHLPDPDDEDYDSEN